MEKELECKSGKIKISLYDGVIKLSELKMNFDELILPVGIVIDEDFVNNKDYIYNLRKFIDIFHTYYDIPKIKEDIQIKYMKISTIKLLKLFFKDKIFLDRLILSDGTKKKISYISFNDVNLELGFINKKGLFRKETENISLEKLSSYSIREYFKNLIKNKMLTKEEIDEIHKRGNLTIGEIVSEWESHDLCMPADSSGERCKKFGNCHECLIDYASYNLEHTSLGSHLKLTNLEDFPPIESDITLFELYDLDECISAFFETKEEMNLFINASGCNGKTFKLDFYYHKDGIDNVVVETDDSGEITYYKIIDEETCMPYLLNDNNLEYISKPVDLIYWPIIDVLKTKGISFRKDKCKVK